MSEHFGHFQRWGTSNPLKYFFYFLFLISVISIPENIKKITHADKFYEKKSDSTHPSVYQHPPQGWP